MAGLRALSAAATSIVRLLDGELGVAFPNGIGGQTPRARLLRTEDLDTRIADVPRPSVTAFVHRVDFDKATRAAFAVNARPDGPPYLPLEMRFFLTAWGRNPEDELALLGASMLAIEASPILGSQLLDPAGEWETDESLQVVLEDISTEAVMRMFDSLPVDYHLSVPYIARVVKLAVPSIPVGVTSSVQINAVSTSDRRLVAR